MALFDEALKYVGVPFLHQGRSSAGLDCLGLIVVAGRDMGIEFQDKLDYPQVPSFEELDSVLRQQVDEDPEGEICLMASSHYHLPIHMGLIRGTRLIHAVLRHGVVVSRVPRSFTITSRFSLR